MRILHVIPQFPYFGGRTIIGGHASCLMTLALSQHGSGAEPTILSYVHDRGGSMQIDDGPPVHSLFEQATPGSVRFGLEFKREALRWAADRRDQFDVIHVHSGFADYFLVSGTIGAATGLPVVHTLYCPIPAQGGRWRLPIVHSMINRWAKRVDVLVAMSQSVSDSMVAFGMGEVQVIKPPVDIHRFHARPCPKERAALGLDDDDVAFLFVGNAKPQKNLTGVFRAFARVRERHEHAKLVVTTELAQSSPDEKLLQRRQEMVDLGLEPHVVQRGIVDDMPRLMQACDVLVAPFLDSFGPSDYFMAALEAMACGKPAIVSAVGGMPEVVDDERGALVDPHDIDAIATAMDRFAGDADGRRTAGRHARSYTEAHFDPQRVVERYDTLYRGIQS